MRIQTALLALALAVGAAPLSAQVARRPEPTRRPTSTGTGTIGDIIFGQQVDTAGTRGCRVRDAVTPDGRVVQICDDRRDRRGRDEDDDAREERGCGAQSDCHVNDRDGDGDFDANDRAIRKREHELQKQQRKLDTQRHKLEKKRGKDD